MLSLRSVKCSLHAPRSRSHQRHHSAFRASHLAQHRLLPAHLPTTNATPAPQQHSRTNLTPHPSASVVPLPSPRTIQIQHTTAMRRGAAWPPAARPSSCVAVQPAVSRWQVPHRRAVMVAERRVCRPQQHGSPSHRALVALSASTCPASGRPVSGVRHVSSVRRPVHVQRPRAWCPRVRYPVPCPRPVSSASVRHPCPLCPHR